MNAPTPLSLIELYDAIKSIATQHPSKIALGELRQGPPPTNALPKDKIGQGRFGIILGGEPYGTSLNITQHPQSGLQVNIIEWGQPPLKNALGTGVRPKSILELVKELTPTIDPVNPPRAKLLIDNLSRIQTRLQREARQSAKKDLQEGNLCA